MVGGRLIGMMPVKYGRRSIEVSILFFFFFARELHLHQYPHSYI